MKNYEKNTVITFLRKKGFSFKEGKIISVRRADIIKRMIGNSTWGRVDFLVNYCGFKFSINED